MKREKGQQTTGPITLFLPPSGPVSREYLTCSCPTLPASGTSSMTKERSCRRPDTPLPFAGLPEAGRTSACPPLLWRQRVRCSSGAGDISTVGVRVGQGPFREPAHRVAVFKDQVVGYRKDLLPIFGKTALQIFSDAEFFANFVKEVRSSAKTAFALD